MTQSPAQLALLQQMQPNPNIGVPPKFVDGAGNVNVQSLSQGVQLLGGNPLDFLRSDNTFDIPGMAGAYTQLEQARNVQPAPVAAAAPAPALQTTVAENPQQVNWDAVQTEISTTGTLSPGTLANLKTAGIPDHMIQATIQGAAAIAENNVLKMADQVGGQENYAAFINWANQHMDVADRQTLVSAMNAPGGHLALQGAFAQFVAAGGPEAAVAGGEPVTFETLGAAGAGGGGGPQAAIFQSRTQRHAAFADPRYGRDPEYTAQVQDTARATHAHVTQLKLRPTM